jgi:hypothetical protein
MTKDQKNNLLISGLFIFLFLIILDLFILNKRIDNNKNVFYEKYLKQLEQQNVETQKKIDSLNLLLVDGQKELKRIADQKEKIKAIYIKNERKIDTLSASQLIVEFSKFFSTSNKK